MVNNPFRDTGCLAYGGNALIWANYDRARKAWELARTDPGRGNQSMEGFVTIDERASSYVEQQGATLMCCDQADRGSETP